MSMPNPRLAGRYAKAACRSSKELVNLLKSPVIKADKKGKILDAITAGKINVITASFNKLLLVKSRESFLPEIASAFVDQYKHYKGIHTANLTTATAVSEELKQSIMDKIRSDSGLKNIELNTAVDPALIGGFVLEMGDQLVDASIAFDLKNIKKQFRNNDFIYKIR
jgi:F-type H+-transporting ATPase subunit delta